MSSPEGRNGTFQTKVTPLTAAWLEAQKLFLEMNLKLM